MIYRLVLNPNNSMVVNDLKNIHKLHSTICSMFGRGVLWRLKNNALYVRDCAPVFIPHNYITSMTMKKEHWGDVAGFELTANPTKVIRDDDRKHGRRVPTEPISWIKRKASTAGFNIIDCIVENAQTVFGAKKNHRLVFSKVDFVGKLEITDRKLFNEALNGGIGPSKGYGFGLLMHRGNV